MIFFVNVSIFTYIKYLLKHIYTTSHEFNIDMTLRSFKHQEYINNKYTHHTICKVGCCSGYLGEQHVLKIMEMRLMPLTKMVREFC
jgi:hypothetical protein